MATTQTDRPARSRRGLAAALTAAAAAAAMVACGGAAMAATPAHHGHTRPAPPATAAAPAPAAPAPAAAAAAAGAPLNCAAAPSKCGYPDATNSGVPAGTALKAVPGQVSSGPGWHYDSRGWVEVTGNGANLTGLSIPYNVDVTASNVTLNHDTSSPAAPSASASATPPASPSRTPPSAAPTPPAAASTPPSPTSTATPPP